ncbi:hypothetical protein [Actinospongicola halichondriae]|uniref:hypothetical protein n=1 Tax=Actinospongicola halichondriae TaxID=3236844 RepID=UPI003D3D1CC2
MISSEATGLRQRANPTIETIATLLAVGLIALLAFIPFTNGWRTPVSPLDEGMTLVYGEQLLDGAIPGESFDTTFPPGSSMMISASYLVFGERLTAARAVGLGGRLLLLASIGLMLRRWGRAAALLGMGFTALLKVTGGVAVFPMSLGVAVLFAGAAVTVEATTRQGRARTVAFAVAGGLLGLAGATRFDFGLAIAATLGVVALTAPTDRRPMLVGALFGSAPLLYQLLAAGPSVTVTKLVLEPAFVWGPYRRVPLGDASPELQLRLVAIAVLFTVVVAWGVHAAVRLRGDERVRSVALAALALPTLPYAVQRLDGGHSSASLRMLLLIVVAIGATVGARRWGRPVAGTSAAVAIAALVVLPTSIDNGILRTLRIPTTIETSPVVVGTEGRWVHVPERTRQSLQEISDTLSQRSAPGERLVVGTKDPRRVFLVDTYIYFLFPHLQPGTYYMEFNPGVVNGQDSGYADDVRAADWLILNADYDAAADERQDPGPDEAIHVVDELFCEIPVSGPLSLYERCDRRA